MSLDLWFATYRLTCDSGKCNRCDEGDAKTPNEAVGLGLVKGWIIHATGWTSCPDCAGLCDSVTYYGRDCICKRLLGGGA